MTYLRNLTYPRMMLGTPHQQHGLHDPRQPEGRHRDRHGRPWPCTRATNGRPSNNSSPGSPWFDGGSMPLQ